MSRHKPVVKTAQSKAFGQNFRGWARTSRLPVMSRITGVHPVGTFGRPAPAG